jgi:BirA family biotin operon repressor/biotin-[acetyl-CoA-carboxylase] ligase
LTPSWEGHDAGWWQQHLQVPAVILHETVGSTNDVARQLAEAGAQTLTLVITDHQTHGRGRAGRSWLSASGSSLLCSIIFRASARRGATPGAVPLRIGNAVAHAIEQVAGVDTELKWPNDVLIAGQGKVAGILCEAVTRHPGDDYIVAGIGVNVTDPGEPYGSISRASAHSVTRGRLLQHIVDALRVRATQITSPLTAEELAEIQRRDILFGRDVADDNKQLGRACGVASDGSLLVETEQGVKHIHSASIRLAHTGAYPGGTT